jgi:hypothetical protein
MDCSSRSSFRDGYGRRELLAKLRYRKSTHAFGAESARAGIEHWK